MTNRRERLSASPHFVIEALPSIGPLMITAKNGGATHERIGTIERVTTEKGWLVCSGAEHDSRIDPTAIAEVIVDRTSVMQEQVYPRIDFVAADGTVLFSVVGFGGIAPFDAAIVPLGGGEALPEKPRDPPGERPEIAETDPGAQPLKAAMAAGQRVTISFVRTGFEQRWTGTIETVKPAMGFNNVMRPDFHLHLKGGSVQSWQQDVADDVTVLTAIGEGGVASGLTITGPADVFAEAVA